MERYKAVCKKINEQIKPSDEFVQSLKDNLAQKVTQEKKQRKSYFTKVAMIFFTITLISSGAFAKDIGNWLSQLFANTDETMQVAYDNGYVQNVDMDYVENDGIAIKVNSLLIDDNKMNVVFDVRGEIDGDLTINELILSGKNRIDEYSIKNLRVLNSSYKREMKSIDKNNHILILEIENINYKLNTLENIEISINGIYIMSKDNNVKYIDNKWECFINLDEDNFNRKLSDTSLSIKENEYLEKYEINQSVTSTNIKLCFKDDLNLDPLKDRKNIIIEDSNGNEIFCREFSRIENDKLKLNIPITSSDDVKMFTIKLMLENEIDLYVYKK